jgi:hypothetical protein
MKKFVNVAIIIAILAGVALLNYSCQKPTPPKAVVLVVDENNVPIKGARVIVKAANSDSAHTVVYLLNEAKSVADTSWTDKEGKVFYDFKYESIYKVEVTVGTDRDHPFARRGIGILILENDKTIESKIEVNEQTVFSNEG